MKHRAADEANRRQYRWGDGLHQKPETVYPFADPIREPDAHANV